MRQMTIDFDSALAEGACGQKPRHDVQLDRLFQVRELLRCGEKLLRGLNHITFIGNIGREKLFEAPTNPSATPLHEDVNNTNPREHATRLRARGRGEVPFYDHSDWKKCLEQLRQWEDGRVQTVGFERGFWSLKKAEEDKIVRAFNKRFGKRRGRDALTFIIENPLDSPRKDAVSDDGTSVTDPLVLDDEEE